MNRERILEIANDIEANGPSRPGFNMSWFFIAQDLRHFDLKDGFCGTTACIAGYVSALKVEGFTLFGNHAHRAKKWLELDDFESEILFCGLNSPVDLEDITPEMAVICLRNLADTGEVDWETATRTTKETS